jgi:hypothetical protein
LYLASNNNSNDHEILNKKIKKELAQDY